MHIPVRSDLRDREKGRVIGRQKERGKGEKARKGTERGTKDETRSLKGNLVERGEKGYKILPTFYFVYVGP